MVVKVKKYNQVYLPIITRVGDYNWKYLYFKNNDKSGKYILRGQRNVRYHEKILSNKRKTFNFGCTSNSM